MNTTESTNTNIFKIIKNQCLAAVAVRVINIIGTKDNHFSTLSGVTKMNVFSHIYEEGAELLSTEISDP